MTPKYELGAEPGRPGGLARQRHETRRPVAHQYLRRAVRKPQKQVSLVKKAAWALYDRKHSHKLSQQITGFMDDLDDMACRGLVVSWHGPSLKDLKMNEPF